MTRKKKKKKRKKYGDFGMRTEGLLTGVATVAVGIGGLKAISNI